MAFAAKSFIGSAARVAATTNGGKTRAMAAKPSGSLSKFYGARARARAAAGTLALSACARVFFIFFLVGARRRRRGRR